MSNSRISSKPIGHIALCVDNLPESVAFYVSLGLRLSYQHEDMAYLYSGNQGIALMRRGSPEAKPHFGFECHSCKEVEAFHQAFAHQGISTSPIQRMGDAAAFYLQDPAGNWLEYIYEPPYSPELTESQSS